MPPFADKAAEWAGACWRLCKGSVSLAARVGGRWCSAPPRTLSKFWARRFRADSWASLLRCGRSGRSLSRPCFELGAGIFLVLLGCYVFFVAWSLSPLFEIPEMVPDIWIGKGDEKWLDVVVKLELSNPNPLKFVVDEGSDVTIDLGEDERRLLDLRGKAAVLPALGQTSLELRGHPESYVGAGLGVGKMWWQTDMPLWLNVKLELTATFETFLGAFEPFAGELTMKCLLILDRLNFRKSICASSSFELVEEIEAEKAGDHLGPLGDKSPILQYGYQLSVLAAALVTALFTCAALCFWGALEAWRAQGAPARSIVHDTGIQMAVIGPTASAPLEPEAVSVAAV